jgi:hypothetical protein
MNQIILASLLMMFAGNAAAADFDFSNNREYQKKYPDLACIDVGPLTDNEKAEYDAAKLQKLGQSAKVSYKRPACYGDGGGAGSTVSEDISGPEFLDRLYARLTSGPLPHGFFDGKVVISKEHGIKNIRELGIKIPDEERIEAFAERMWNGKYIDRNLLYVKNRINLDGQQVQPPPKKITDPRMKFPAKLYCGQSLFDSRRESILIDYRYGVEDLPPGVDTDPNLDWLAGKKGLLIRDEIRMVKPGLYLGRAYLQGVFGLYFILEYVDGTGDAPSAAEKDSCWVGHQRQRQLNVSRSDYVNNL